MCTRSNPRHGRQHLPRNGYGSQAVVPFAESPVRQPLQPTPMGERGRPKQLAFNVLVAFDDTAASWSALEAASAIASACRGTLTIAHVVQPRVSSLDGGSTILRALEAEREQAWNLLSFASQSVRPAVAVDMEVLNGDPVDAVVRRAVEVEADLIVVGSHRRGALERLVVGSISERILRRAGLPVLVVPVMKDAQTARRRTAPARRESELSRAA